MTKVLPIRNEKAIEKLFKSKKIVKNARKVPVDIKEMIKMNERLAKTEQEFRSKSAQSSMAVRRFFYNV